MASKSDLNAASGAELEEIIGTGAKRAHSIVEYREQRGGFQSVDELDEIPGFVLTDESRALLTVGGRKEPE